MKSTIDFLKEKLITLNESQLSESDFTEITTALATYVPDNYNEETKFFREVYKTYSLTIDCLILWNISLSLILIQDIFDRLKRGITNFEYFFFIQVNITNNIISVKNLYELGFDTQARTIFRNSIELFDLALCILDNTEFFNKHIHKSDQLDHITGNPYKTPKNKNISKIAEAITQRLFLSEKESSGDAEIINTLWSVYRLEQYALLSQEAHGNHHFIINNGFKATEKNIIEPAIGGGKWKNLEYFLSDICMHQIMWKRNIQILLKEKHKVDIYDKSHSLEKFIFFIDQVIGKELLMDIMRSRISDEDYEKFKNNTA